MKKSTFAIFLLCLCCFLSIKPAQCLALEELEAEVEEEVYADAVEEEEEGDDEGDEGQEELNPEKAILSTKHPALLAKKCIDGKDDGPDKLGTSVSDMCHSKGGEPTPWLAIDYGEDVRVSVGKTVIVNRKWCCADRTKNIEVRLSNELPKDGKSMFTGGILLGKFAGPGKKGERIEIESEEGPWEQYIGRYLIVQMDNGNQPINLKEVTAFGKAY